VRTHSPLVKLNNTPLARIIKSIDIGKPGLISRALGQIAYMVTRSESFLLDLKLTKRNRGIHSRIKRQFERQFEKPFEKSWCMRFLLRYIGNLILVSNYLTCIPCRTLKCDSNPTSVGLLVAVHDDDEPPLTFCWLLARM
jgi:hypothetical protein